MSRDSYTVEVLGTFRVHRHGRLVDLPTSSARTVSCLVVVDGDGSRARLAARLWPDAPARQASSNLRTALWRLEQRAPGLVRPTGGALTLAAQEVDLSALRTWMHEAITATRQPMPAPLGATRELLAGWDEPWLDDARAELHLLRVHALESVGSSMLVAGRVGEACEAALAAVGLDPARESATRLLIDVHLRGGNTIEALRCYRQFAALLQREIGAPPSPSLAAMVAGQLGAAPVQGPARSRTRRTLARPRRDDQEAVGRRT
jgi:DNA-binding SARP family transcriptional activator